MQIGIDARIFKTGIGRYVQSLIRELERVDHENEYVVFLRNEDFDKYQPAAPNFSKIKADCPPYSFKEQLLMPLILTRFNLDLVHFTNFNVPILWWGKYVLTIHDLIHQEYSTFGSTTRNRLYYLFKKLVYLLVIRWAVFRAVKIIVPSNDVKKDVVKYLRVKPGKITITYEGLDWSFEDQRSKIKDQSQEQSLKILGKYGVRQPYLLYVATMYPHKNHRRLIEAFEKLQQGNKKERVAPAIRGGSSEAQRRRLVPSVARDQVPPELVLVGKVDYFSKQLKNFVEQKGLSDKIIFPNFQTSDGYLPDEDLAVFYANTAVYVFPSLKEGFGIPILEAWSFGVPVAAANTSSLPEVGGNAVLYFDPNNVDDIVEAIREILMNEDLRENLIKKGHQRLKEFSWVKMAAQTREIYRTVMLK